MKRVILHLNEDSDGILALRAARSMMKDGHRFSVYSYENGVSIYAYRTTTGVAAREEQGMAKTQVSL